LPRQSVGAGPRADGTAIAWLSLAANEAINFARADSCGASPSSRAGLLERDDSLGVLVNLCVLATFRRVLKALLAEELTEARIRRN
jgi:hypothetical protein